MSTSPITAPLSLRAVQRIYDVLSPFYESLTRYETLTTERGLEVAGIQRGNVVLEVGFGTGQTVIALAARVGSTGHVYGLDVSPKMVATTRRRVKEGQMTARVDLQLGDVHNLPYASSVFHAVFTSFLLDLIDTPAISPVLQGFLRVLRPGGRLVVVNMSTGGGQNAIMKLYEGLYRRCPFVFGGCRPVAIAPFMEALGFQRVTRECLMAGHLLPCEIVWGDAPPVAPHTLPLGYSE